IEVKAETPLYTIDEREFKTAKRKADAELKVAHVQIKVKEAEQKKAEVELTKLKDSYAKGVAGRADLDVAQAIADVAKTEVDVAKENVGVAEEAVHSAKIQLEYTSIKAKIDGRISRKLQHKGNLVQADTTLLTTILRVDELYVYFDAPEADLVVSQKSAKN